MPAIILIIHLVIILILRRAAVLGVVNAALHPRVHNAENKTVAVVLGFLDLSRDQSWWLHVLNMYRTNQKSLTHPTLLTVVMAL